MFFRYLVKILTGTTTTPVTHRVPLVQGLNPCLIFRSPQELIKAFLQAFTVFKLTFP